jgi:hypothetical protein
MGVTNGPNLGRIINAATGDLFDVDFRSLLRMLDVLLQGAVISRTLTSAPGSPANGDRYIVGASATGAWSGHDKSIAVWTTDNPATPGGLWEFYAPEPGWAVVSIADASLYIYLAGAWSAVSGGGGGGIPAGSNVVQLINFNTTDTFNGYTLFLKIPGRNILNMASSWKFSLWVVSGTFTADNCKVLRTAIDSLTVIDSTNVTWSGGACSIGPGEQFCDAISLALDTAHDYWVAIHGTSNSPLKVQAIVPSHLTGAGYAAGDKTAVSTIPSTNAEVGVSRVISS